MSKVPSYYEIALTQRQVVIAFVILLVCLVAAFFSGVWVGSGAHGPRTIGQADELGGDRLGGDRLGSTSSANEEPRQPVGTETGSESDSGSESESGNLRFFSEAGSEAPPSPAGRVHDDPDDPRRRNDLPTPVRPSPQAPEPVDPRATEPPGAGGPVIQVFSSHDQAQAQQVLDRLLVADLDAYLSPAEVNGVIHYRVRIGPFRDRDQAEAVAAQLRRDYQLETWITR